MCADLAFTRDAEGLLTTRSGHSCCSKADRQRMMGVANRTPIRGRRAACCAWAAPAAIARPAPAARMKLRRSIMGELYYVHRG